MTRKLKSFTQLPDRMVAPLSDYVSEFSSHFTAGLQQIAQAAKVYAEAVRKYSTAEEEFRKAYKGVRESTWTTLLHIGNGDMPPSAYGLLEQSRDKLLALPYKTQEQLLESGAKQSYVLPNGKVVNTSVSNATPAMLDILIDAKTGKIRSVEEQKTLIKPRVASVAGKTKITDSASYRIVGKTLHVKGVIIGVGELKAILREMGE